MDKKFSFESFESILLCYICSYHFLFSIANVTLLHQFCCRWLSFVCARFTIVVNATMTTLMYDLETLHEYLNLYSIRCQHYNALQILNRYFSCVCSKNDPLRCDFYLFCSLFSFRAFTLSLADSICMVKWKRNRMNGRDCSA